MRSPRSVQTLSQNALFPSSPLFLNHTTCLANFVSLVAQPWKLEPKPSASLIAVVAKVALVLSAGFADERSTRVVLLPFRRCHIRYLQRIVERRSPCCLGCVWASAWV